LQAKLVWTLGRKSFLGEKVMRPLSIGTINND